MKSKDVSIMCPYYDPFSRSCRISGKEMPADKEEEFCTTGNCGSCPAYKAKNA